MCSSDFRSIKDFGSLVIRRTRTANGAENHTAENDQSAKQGVGSHSFAEEQEDPNWIQNRLQRADKVRFQGGDVFDANGEKHERKSELKYSEIGEDQPVGGCPCFLEDERETKYGCCEAGNQKAFCGCAILLCAKGNDHDGRGKSAQHCEDVSVETVCAQFIPEEQKHPKEDDEHRKPVRSRGLFTQEPVSQQDDVNWRGVL